LLYCYAHRAGIDFVRDVTQRSGAGRHTGRRFPHISQQHGQGTRAAPRHEISLLFFGAFNAVKDTGVITVSTTVFDLNDGSVKVNRRPPHALALVMQFDADAECPCLALIRGVQIFEGRNPKVNSDSPTLVLQL
jgi:hypothetical protein